MRRFGAAGMSLLIGAVLVLDRITKIAAEHALAVGQSVPVIKGVFHFTLVHNTGAAFGLFKNWVLLLALVSACVLVLLWLTLVRAGKNPHLASYRIPLSLVFGGALGNLIDRLFLGYVIDFLDLRVWPVFNIADSAITIGAVLLAILLIREPAGHRTAVQ
ncbi:MAG: signal peptidase II [Deltaproteobacteria bacterium]